MAGINTPAILPFGAGDGSVQGIGGTRSGTGRTIKNKGMGKLFGLEVGNAGLVVLLDNSDSMKTVAAQVRKLVEREFPTALCMELSGALFCDEKNLDKLGRSKKIGEPLLGYYRSGLAKSVISLTVNHLQTCQTAPESVYMMSDFEDYVDFPSVNEFGALLAEKKVKFFAHSVGQRPPSAITRLCQQTGGAVLLLPPEKLPEVTDEKE
ncbi:MAG: hypothetical protein LBK60_12315 [Verrucomicrobiales bacterium]|nr:hypothetical protein [Verrucomicrobiales bacterium]